MYSPEVTSKRLDNLAGAIRKSSDPAFQFVDLAVDRREGMVAKLNALWNPEEGTLKRPLGLDEEAFIRH